MRVRALHILTIAVAGAGAIFGGIAYFAQGTGVTGTGGALTAFLGALAVALAALLDMLAAMGRRAHTALRLVIVIGAALTAVAAYMLLQPVFAGLMLLAAVLALALSVPGVERRPA